MDHKQFATFKHDTDKSIQSNANIIPIDLSSAESMFRIRKD
jgi:hypothetical protein